MALGFERSGSVFGAVFSSAQPVAMQAGESYEPVLMSTQPLYGMHRLAN